MFAFEDKLKAKKLYLKYESYAAAINELGYPSRGDTSAQSVADKVGVSRESLYKFKDQGIFLGTLTNKEKAILIDALCPKYKLSQLLSIVNIPAGKVYLSPMGDCFEGAVMNCTISTTPKAELVNTMLDQAVKILPKDVHPTIYTDCGAHYRWQG